MKSPALFFGFLLLMLFSPSMLSAQTASLTDEQKEKIDGSLALVLNEQYPELDMPVASGVMLPEPVVRDNVTYYDVMIHTEDVSVVENMGISTGADIKTKDNLKVVTAQVTPVQIVDLAQLGQVKKIKASKMAKPYK